MKYRALIVEEVNGNYLSRIGERTAEGLGAGEVLIRVEYSSLNYKDALSATGHKGVTKTYPHTPGIDAAGVIAESNSENFAVGDAVLVTGYDLGMNTNGGFAEYIRVPEQWVVAVPKQFSTLDAMICGTAGYTAGLSLLRLEHNGLQPGALPVLVTGATGGVGSYAVALLHAAGYKVAAASRKADAAEFLRSLGATEIIDTTELIKLASRPLAKAQFAGAIDTVGGTVLTAALASCAMFGSVASCGLTQSAQFASSVYPFIIRGNNLLGINSAETPMEERVKVWEIIAQKYRPVLPAHYYQVVSLEELPHLFEIILAGGVTGRYVVKI